METDVHRCGKQHQLHQEIAPGTGQTGGQLLQTKRRPYDQQCHTAAAVGQKLQPLEEPLGKGIFYPRDRQHYPGETRQDERGSQGLDEGLLDRRRGKTALHRHLSAGDGKGVVEDHAYGQIDRQGADSHISHESRYQRQPDEHDVAPHSPQHGHGSPLFRQPQTGRHCEDRQYHHREGAVQHRYIAPV